MEYQEIKYELDGAAARIVLNAPDKLNAISRSMAIECLDAIVKAQKEARVIVLSGAGNAFCSGINLANAGIDISDPNRDIGKNLEDFLNPLLMAMRDCDIPIITSLRGACAGIGSSIALMGDIIIASKSAYFLQAFVNLGLVPDGGAAYILSRAIGRVRAMELMLLGEKLFAEKAFEFGLITRVVEDADLEAVTKELAQRLAMGPTVSLGIIRNSAWEALEIDFPTQLSRERELQSKAGLSSDFLEGVMAFFQKRKPDFKGK